ncbi:MAG: hypothetical protein OEY89_02450 [Gammaproteobacteria bacterium]|nr:hypothetical protein [Gammaproteobacteria bacterium]
MTYEIWSTGSFAIGVSAGVMLMAIFVFNELIKGEPDEAYNVIKVLIPAMAIAVFIVVYFHLFTQIFIYWLEN